MQQGRPAPPTGPHASVRRNNSWRAWFLACVNAWVDMHLYAAILIWSLMHRVAMKVKQLGVQETVHEAVARWDMHKVNRLVRAGANLSAPDAKGRTALHVALERLEQEQEDEDRDEGEEGAANSSAASAGRLELVHWLLSNQIDVNARDAQEQAPIHIAVRAGLHQVVRGLMNANADPTMGYKGGSTLRQATLQGDERMVKLLLEGATSFARASGGGLAMPPSYVNGTGRDGWTALGLASRTGHVAIVETLLGCGADRSMLMSVGKTALDIAQSNKKGAVVSLLASS
mgnify:CR=1 FL=1|jgi:ankyrin repeat protein